MICFRPWPRASSAVRNLWQLYHALERLVAAQLQVIEESNHRVLGETAPYTKPKDKRALLSERA